ncbi:metal binding domain of Ada-domain-containing protein [Xylaria digitata]|nr:metal binding domain of Ada-domain-containing protein [Xylaria digitata]
MTRRKTVAIPRDKTKPANPTSILTDEAKWRLVLTHTPALDFLYAVLSTGIFCRTSCPSRRPRRANVRFFDSAASAVAAGFRACRRCRPESTDSSHESPQASAKKRIEAACEYVRQRKGEAQLLEIAAHVGLSSRYLHGLFKQVLDTTPGAYAAAVRQENSISTIPITAVSDSTPHIVDLGNITGFAHLDSIGEGACGISFENSHQSMNDWLPEGLEDLNCINFDQGPFSAEWANCCDLDAGGSLRTSGESLGPRMDTYSSDCVDPSLLSSLGVAS